MIPFLNLSFTIDGNILRTAEVFDYKSKNSYDIRVKVTDSTDLEFVKDFSISVVDVLIPELRLTRSGTQSLTDSLIAFTDIDWAASDIDTNSMFNFGTSATDVTIPETGYYIFSSTLDWQSDAIGTRALTFTKNATQYSIDVVLGNSTGSAANQLTSVLNFAASDVLKVNAKQNSGSTINITSNAFHHLSGYKLPEDIYVRATRSADQTITDSTSAVVDLNLETYDSDNLHNTGVNSERIDIPEDGWYIVEANLIWEGQPSGTRFTAITLNDGTGEVVAMSSQQPRGGMPVAGQVFFVERLTSPNYIGLGVFQDSGGDVDVMGTFGDA